MATFQIHQDDEENCFPKVKCRKVSAIPKYTGKGHLKKNDEDKENKVSKIRYSKNELLKEDVKRLKLNDDKEKLAKVVAKTDKIVLNESNENCQAKPELEELILELEENKIENATKEKEKFFLDPFHADEYREEIWTYLLHMEKMISGPKPNYMSKQAQLTWKMRSILIDWLMSVCEEYRLGDQSLHLAVNYLDRFLSYISVARGKFQLVGAAAMMLAAKVEEVYPPTAAEWAYLTGDTYTTRQVLKMEQLMLKVLCYRMQPPTIFTFLEHFCTEHSLDAKTMCLAMYLSELVLLEGQDYLQHFPSLLAAASIVLARLTLFKKKPWPLPLKASSGYSLKELSPVVKRQHKTFRDSPLSENQAVQKKYNQDKYHKVALLKPRALNLDELDEAD